MGSRVRVPYAPQTTLRKSSRSRFFYTIAFDTPDGGITTQQLTPDLFTPNPAHTFPTRQLRETGILQIYQPIEQQILQEQQQAQAEITQQPEQTVSPSANNLGTVSSADRRDAPLVRDENQTGNISDSPIGEVPQGEGVNSNSQNIQPYDTNSTSTAPRITQQGAESRTIQPSTQPSNSTPIPQNSQDTATNQPTTTTPIDTGSTRSDVVDNQGNPVDTDGNLIVVPVASIDEITNQDFETPTRTIALPSLPDNVSNAIGTNGRPVIIKKNVFEKNHKNHKDLSPADSREILKQTLFNPNLYGQNQKASRPYNWILIHLADPNTAVIIEVNENKENVEIVNWHYLRGESLEQKKKQAIKEGGLILTLESAVGNTLDSSISHKDSERRENNKISSLNFSSEPNPILSKDTTNSQTSNNSPSQFSPDINDGRKNEVLLAHIDTWKRTINAPIVVLSNIHQVNNPQARAAIASATLTAQRYPGWFADDTIYIYLPHATDTADIDRTILHECIAHYGVRQLFRSPEQLNRFYDQVWQMMNHTQRTQFLRYPGISNLTGNKARRAAADEYIAHLAEQLHTQGTTITPEQTSIWQRIVTFLRNALRQAGINIAITDADINNTLLSAYQQLKSKNDLKTQQTVSSPAVSPSARRDAPLVRNESQGDSITENENLKTENISDFTSPISPFTSQSPHTTANDELDIFLRESRAANERHREQWKAIPHPRDLQQAYETNDTDAITQWKARWETFLQQLIPMDIPVIDSTITTASRNKAVKMVQTPSGYKTDKDSAIYKVFDYIEKSLVKRRRQLERNLTPEERHTIDIVKRGLRGELTADAPTTSDNNTTFRAIRPDESITDYAQAVANSPSARRDRGSAVGEGVDYSTRFRFIGERGAANLDQSEEATTRLDNLAVARSMEQDGRDERTIKLATGWERGADNLWRYEMPDTPINQNALLTKHQSGATITILSSLIDDERLFKAYPELYGMVVAFQQLPLGELGNYSPRNAMGMPANIILSEDFLSRRENPQWREEVKRMEQLPIIKQWSDAMEAEPFDMQALEDAEKAFKASHLWEEYNTLLEGKGKYPRYITGIGGESTLAHEVQHAIQDIEGFARGGNERTADVLQDKARSWAWRNALVETAREHPELAGTTAIEQLLIDEYTQDGLQEYIPTPEQRIKGFNLYVRGYDNEGYQSAWEQMSKIRPGDKRGTYRRLAGEVEARNVAHRLNYTPEERAATLARLTEDVARKDQIFISQALGNPAMGSRVEQRMKEIASHYQGRTLSSIEQAIVNVFSGAADNLPVSVKTSDGNTRRIIMRQGKEQNAGTKHSLFRHYNTGSGVINADDLLLIPEVIANGTRTEKGKGKIEYRYTHDNGTKYTVLTEKNNRGAEVFADFYTNRSGNARSSNTQLSAQADSITAPSARKGTTNNSNTQTRFRAIDTYTVTEDIKRIVGISSQVRHSHYVKGTTLRGETWQLRISDHPAAFINIEDHLQDDEQMPDYFTSIVITDNPDVITRGRETLEQQRRRFNNSPDFDNIELDQVIIDTRTLNSDNYQDFLDEFSEHFDLFRQTGRSYFNDDYGTRFRYISENSNPETEQTVSSSAVSPAERRDAPLVRDNTQTSNISPSAVSAPAVSPSARRDRGSGVAEGVQDIGGVVEDRGGSISPHTIADATIAHLEQIGDQYTAYIADTADQLSQALTPQPTDDARTLAEKAILRFRFADDTTTSPLAGRDAPPVREEISMGSVSPEEQDIIDNAKANGTYLLAPNGRPTNLTPRQWVQVRTQAFKQWFGDWLKQARVNKLRYATDATITGNEIEITDNEKQNKKNALEYGKTLQGEYTNKDTGNTIQLQRGRKNGGINEVLQHNYKDAEHLQSIAAIPQIIVNSIFVEEVPNKDTSKNPDVVAYQHYVCGLKIGNTDYTVHSLVAVDKKGDRYYDHNLIHIEKIKLLDIVQRQAVNGIGFGTTPDTKSTTNSDYKYNALLSILQTNASKIVDENGEPMVVYHGTRENFTVFDSGKNNPTNEGFYFTDKIDLAKKFAGPNGHVGEFYINIKNPNIGGFDGSGAVMRKSEYRDGGIFTKRQSDRYAEKGTKEFIVFSPNQIKSATDNIGTFDTDNPDIRFRSVRDGEFLNRNNLTPEEFALLVNNISLAMDTNDRNHRMTWFTEQHFDSMQRLANLIADIPGFDPDSPYNPWITQNQAKSRAQAAIRLFDANFKQPLYDAIDRCLRKIMPGIDTRNKNHIDQAYTTLSLYVQARTALERQDVQEQKAREEAEKNPNPDSTIDPADHDFAGLAGIQFDIIGRHGLIDEKVEKIKNDRHKLQAFAIDNNVPTVQEFVDEIEEKIGTPFDADNEATQLWQAIQSISEYQLATSYIASLTSRSGYQVLTYGIDIDALLRERHDGQTKAIKDNPASYDNVTDYDTNGNATARIRDGTRHHELQQHKRVDSIPVTTIYVHKVDSVPVVVEVVKEVTPS